MDSKGGGTDGVGKTSSGWGGWFRGLGTEASGRLGVSISETLNGSPLWLPSLEVLREH